MKLLKGQKLRDDRKAKVPLVKDHIQDKGPSLLFNFRKIETQCQKVINRGMPRAEAFKRNQRRH